MTDTGFDSITHKVAQARTSFASGQTKSLDWRQQQLHSLARMLKESSAALEAALLSDLGKHPLDSYLTEISSVISEAQHASKHLHRWSRKKRVASSFALWPSRAMIQYQPYGTSLIIGAWNYPIHLTLMPVIGALAAGNAVVLKPSELAPHCSTLLAELLPQYMDKEAIQVIEGGIEETTELLKKRFDYIFYTGNSKVGSIVMEAAAKHLTPVTLELGGKSPVWIDESFPLEKAAKSLAWGKYSNCGQTCVAPDYVLTTPELAPTLAAAVAGVITEYYGEDPKKSESYGRIVNQRHTQRLASLLDDGQLIAGGTADLEERYIAPTVLLDVKADSAVMRDEIFGPILPIVTVANHQEAIDFINARPKPLALYAYTLDKTVQRNFLQHTSSGSVAFGTVMLQLGVKQLPFGGVGDSGMGAYHGEHSFHAFSHQRAIFEKSHWLDLSAMARPPFTAKKIKMLKPR